MTDVPSPTASRTSLPDGLSMLWEPVEATSALRQRFGFEGLAEVSRWLVAQLDQVWGIAVRGCSRMVISGDNAIIWADTARRGLVVKWSRSETRFAALAASARLLHHLHGREVPVAATVPTLSGQQRVVLAGPGGPLSITVQSEVCGDWLDVTDAAAVRAAGGCLARLHRELRDYSDERLPTRSRIEVSKEVMLATDHGADVSSDPAASRLRRLVDGLPDLDVAPQLVHNDFRAANILTRNRTIVAVLDFDEVALGQPIGDLAYAGVYLSTLFTDWGPTSPGTRAELRAGYESVRALSAAEAQWYEAMVVVLSRVFGTDEATGSSAGPEPVDA